MTEYWVSSPKIWCKDCKIFYDSRPINVKKHETSDRHKDSVARRRGEVAKKQQIAARNSENFQREMRRVESAAYRTHKKDTAYFSQFKRPPNPNEDHSIDKMLSYSKYPKEMNIPIVTPTNHFQTTPKVTKEFAPPPGMKAVVEAVWLYKDSQDKVQGPFKLGEMRNWFSQNYFSKQISVRNISSKKHKFRPIHCWAEIVGQENVQEDNSENLFNEQTKQKTIKRKNRNKKKEKNDLDGKKDDGVLDEFGMGIWTDIASEMVETKTKPKIKQKTKTKIEQKTKRETLFDVVNMKDHLEHSAVVINEDSEKSAERDLNPGVNQEEREEFNWEEKKEERKEERKRLEEKADKEMERRLERDAIESSLGKGGLYAEKEKAIKGVIKMRSRRRKNKSVVSFGVEEN